MLEDELLRLDELNFEELLDLDEELDKEELLDFEELLDLDEELDKEELLDFEELLDLDEELDKEELLDFDDELDGEELLKLDHEELELKYAELEEGGVVLVRLLEELELLDSPPDSLTVYGMPS